MKRIRKELEKAVEKARALRQEGGDAYETALADVLRLQNESEVVAMAVGATGDSWKTAAIPPAANSEVSLDDVRVLLPIETELDGDEDRLEAEDQDKVLQQVILTGSLRGAFIICKVSVFKYRKWEQQQTFGWPLRLDGARDLHVGFLELQMQALIDQGKASSKDIAAIRFKLESLASTTYSSKNRGDEGQAKMDRFIGRVGAADTAPQVAVGAGERSLKPLDPSILEFLGDIPEFAEGDSEL